MDYFLFCSLYPSSLIIACGRVDSDRRQDVVKLCGLLRSDGIFPSAVTLGQYTRAIAEGYSKQNSGTANSIISEAVRDNIPSHEEEAMLWKDYEIFGEVRRRTKRLLAKKTNI